MRGWLFAGAIGLMAIGLAGGVVLGAILDPFGDSHAGPPETIGLGPPPVTGSPPSPSPEPTPSPSRPPTPAPTVVVTEVAVLAVTQVPVPVVTEVPVPVGGEACEMLVSPEAGEVVDILQEARQTHQAWVDYLEANPGVDPPDDGMTRDERISRERGWVGNYDRILLLLQEAWVACSAPMSEGE